MRYRFLLTLTGLVSLLCLLLAAAPTRAAGPSDRQRVAILPFTTPPNEPDLQQYGAGIMDTLISALASVPRYIMIDRARIENILKEQQFAQTGLVDPKSAVAIGKVAGAQDLISGSLVKAGPTVRITARFTEVKTGQIRHSEIVTGPLDNIFDLMDQLAQKFIASTGVQVTDQQMQRIDKVLNSTANLAAYEQYLKGRKAYLLGTPAGYAEAATWFRKAIEMDPKYALAYAGLAETLSLWGYQKQNNGEPYQEEYEQAFAAAQKALELNPDLPQAHRAFGTVSGYLGRPGYEAEVRKALELSPNDAENWYELWFATGNDPNPDHEYIRKALELNPDFNAAHYDRGRALRKLKRYDEAITEFQEALRVSPNDDSSHYGLGRVFLELNRIDEASAKFREAIQLNPRHADAHFYLGKVYADQGRWSDAAGEFEATLRINPKHKEAQEELARARGQI